MSGFDSQAIVAKEQTALGQTKMKRKILGSMMSDRREGRAMTRGYKSRRFFSMDRLEGNKRQHRADQNIGLPL